MIAIVNPGCSALLGNAAIIKASANCHRIVSKALHDGAADCARANPTAVASARQPVQRHLNTAKEQVMKQLAKVLLGMGILWSSVAMAQAEPQFIAADQSAETAVCLAIAANDSKQLRSTLRRFDLSRREVLLTLHCNQMPALQFASYYRLSVAQHYLRQGELLALQQPSAAALAN